MTKRKLPPTSHHNNRPTGQRLLALYVLTWWFLASSSTSPFVFVQASLACRTHAECETAYLAGSECLEGVCTNPFYKHGCLARLPPNQQLKRQRRQRPRICHSEDPPSALALGYCRPMDPHLDYTEVRILTQDWESVFLEAWLIQIVLTEVLGVPATIESGLEEVQLDFYR